MTPDDAESEFRSRLEKAGRTPETLTVADGIETLLAFYVEERAEECEIELDGDMLLYQWGTHNRGSAESFEWSLTRQFLPFGGEDGDDEDRHDEPIQLSLTFHFEPTDALRALKEGHRWCESPDEVDAFRRFVTGSAAFQGVVDQPADQISLKFART